MNDPYFDRQEKFIEKLDQTQTDPMNLGDRLYIVWGVILPIMMLALAIAVYVTLVVILTPLVGLIPALILAVMLGTLAVGVLLFALSIIAWPIVAILGFLLGPILRRP